MTAFGGTNLLSYKQPGVPAQSVAKAARALTRYRIMAFVTGFVLLGGDRKSTRLNSSHHTTSRMPSSA